MRCAIYIRVSTEDQAATGFSVQSQLRALEELAAERCYEVAMREQDDLSGSTLDRPGLTRIRDAAAGRLIDAVLCYDPDRLTRRLAHLLLLQEEFEKRVVRLEFRTQDPVRTSEDRLLLNVRGIIAEYEREKIRERTLRGRREKARRNLWCGGPVPYGYDYAPPGILTISAAEGPVVRQIFAWAESGVSTREIVRRLSAGSSRPRRGGEWRRSSVNRILRSELYYGQGYYLRRKPRDGGKAIKDYRPEADWIPVTVPVLVTERQWRGVQDRLQRNREVLSGRPSHTYLLRGLVRCACGSRMRGACSRGRRSYRCYADCGSGAPEAGGVEAAVFAALVEPFRSPAALRALISDHIDRLRRGSRDVDVLRRRVELLQRKAARGARALIHAASDAEEAAVRDELGRVRSALAEAQGWLDAVDDADATLESVESVRVEIAASLDIVEADLGLRREFIRRIATEVVVQGHQIAIACKLPISSSRSGQFAFTVRAEVA